MAVGPLQTTLLAFSAISVVVYILLTRVLETMQDPREPPSVPGSIPYIGHVVGLMRSKFNYYVQLRSFTSLPGSIALTRWMIAYFLRSRQSSLPIFTMTMPGQKMYIVTTPDLIQAIQKQPKVLAFPPIEAKFALQVCGSSKDAHKILMSNVNGDEGDWGLSMEAYAGMRAALSAGPGLDDMNRVMIQNIAASLDSLKPSRGSRTKIQLADWLRQSVTVATTNSVYGPLNPFKDSAVVDAFWQFESRLMALLVGILPSLTAHNGLAGRAKVVKAFEQYFQANGHQQASVLMKTRYETSANNGISVEDIARFEVGGAIAILVNTAPAVFWMLLLVYYHPGLVGELREEIDKMLAERTSDGETIRSLDITSLKTNCPLLTSTFQEVLRYRSMGTSIRQVMEDTVLDGKWLLKKDCMIQMPSRVIHKDNSIWGSDVDEFNPRRFMKDEPQKTQNGRRPNATAFRAFGGGTTLCPGRHFATNEILAVVTMFIMRYDMKPTTGEWSLPTTQNTNVAAVVMEPDTDVEVEISVREGFEEGQWAFDLKDSGMVFAVVAEDRAE